MGHYKAKTQFTRATTWGMIVGDPKHKDPKGRFFTIPDAIAAPLVTEGLIEELTAAEFHKQSAGGKDKAGAATGTPRVSAKMSNKDLDAEAKRRGIDVSGAKKRADKIKLINAGSGQAEVEGAEGTQNAMSRVAIDTLETTRHPRTGAGTGDLAAAGDLPPGSDEIEPEEQAPLGGGGSSADK